jgi:hypothetical protein
MSIKLNKELVINLFTKYSQVEYALIRLDIFMTGYSLRLFWVDFDIIMCAIIKAS